MQSMRTFATPVVVWALAVSALPHAARADELDDELATWRERPAVASLSTSYPAFVTNAYGGGSGALARSPYGFFAGADGGAAAFFAARDEKQRFAPAFGGRLGYQWVNGLAMHVGFDDLGLEPTVGGGPLLLPAVGLRYSLPFIVEPFAELSIGATFNSVVASPTGGIGLGISVPVVRHLAFELEFRNCMMNVDGSVRDVPTLELGAAVGFIGH